MYTLFYTRFGVKKVFEYIFSIQGIKGVTFVVRLSETPWDQDTLRLNDEKQK